MIPRRPRGISKTGKRSGLEDKIASGLTARGVSFEYEGERIKYQVTKSKTYIPDFKLPNGLYIEAKGWFKAEDRTKLQYVRESNPGIDLRLVFQRASNRLSKTSKTTYADWCDTHGFRWAEREIPEAWINEPARRGNEPGNN